MWRHVAPLIKSIGRNNHHPHSHPHFTPPLTSLPLLIPVVPIVPLRAMSATTRRRDPFKPAARVAGQKQDVWCVRHATTPHLMANPR